VSSSKPDEQRPSAQEKALAEQAMKQDQRYEEAFRPLEQEAIRELETANAEKRSAMLAGRGNSDLEQQAAESAQSGRSADAMANTFGGGSTASRGFRRAGAVSDGRMALKTQSDQKARDSIDQDTLNVIRTGQGIQRQQQSSLAQSARIGFETEGSKLQAESLRDTARLNALMEVGFAAGIRGVDEYSKRKNQSGASKGASANSYGPMGFRAGS